MKATAPRGVLGFDVEISLDQPWRPARLLFDLTRLPAGGSLPSELASPGVLSPAWPSRRSRASVGLPRPAALVSEFPIRWTAPTSGGYSARSGNSASGVTWSSSTTTGGSAWRWGSRTIRNRSRRSSFRNGFTAPSIFSPRAWNYLSRRFAPRAGRRTSWRCSEGRR